MIGGMIVPGTGAWGTLGAPTMAPQSYGLSLGQLALLPIRTIEEQATSELCAAALDLLRSLERKPPRHVLMDHHGTELDPTEIEETKRIWRRADAAFIPKTEGACGEKKPLPAQARNPKGQYGLYCI